jgi:hypothetical protein
MNALNQARPMLRNVGARQISVLANNVVATSTGTRLQPAWLRERCSPRETGWRAGSSSPSDLAIIKARPYLLGKGKPQLQVQFSDGLRSSFDVEMLEAEAEAYFGNKD